MSKTSTKRILVLPTESENRRIRRGARADPDAQPLSKAQLDGMVPIAAVRGRPKAANKKLLVSVRYSPEVLAYFRSTGDGWQARMNGVLQDYVARRARRAKAAL
jgi:uncharacterized protein (DUF4415 family)